MQNLCTYLTIFLGVKLVLILVFGFIIYRQQLRIKRNPPVPAKLQSTEEFHVVKSSIKQVNERFIVGQILFSNRKDFILPTSRGTPRRSTDRQD